MTIRAQSRLFFRRPATAPQLCHKFTYAILYCRLIDPPVAGSARMRLNTHPAIQMYRVNIVSVLMPGSEVCPTPLGNPLIGQVAFFILFTTLPDNPGAILSGNPQSIPW